MSKQICINNNLFYLCCLILLLIGYLIIDKSHLYLNKDNLINKEDCKCDCDCPLPKQNIIKEDKVVVVNNELDDSPTQYKKGPERHYSMGGGLPINIKTRGEPNEYQNIGFLKNNINNEDIKPLYGRRTFRGSHMWNYYCLLNNHIQVKIPIIKKNNCIDERGCEEIFTGDKININNNEYIAEIYPYSDFRYIPYF